MKAQTEGATSEESASEARMASALKDIWKQVVALRRIIESVSDDLAEDRFPGLVAGVRPQTVDTAQISADRALLEILTITGVESHLFMDIGCGRSGGQSRLLATRFGWSGTFVDASQAAVSAMRRAFINRSDISVRHTEVSPENVNELVLNAIGGELDLLNIDIDSYDYWVWEAIVQKPRVVVIEYNAHLGHRPITVPLGAMTDETPRAYSGASLQALQRLGQRKGYGLLGCDRMGNNAYFARLDLVPTSAVVDAADAWRPKIVRTSLDEEPRNSAKALAKIEDADLAFVEV